MFVGSFSQVHQAQAEDLKALTVRKAIPVGFHLGIHPMIYRQARQSLCAGASCLHVSHNTSCTQCCAHLLSFSGCIATAVILCWAMPDVLMGPLYKTPRFAHQTIARQVLVQGGVRTT